ncbi:MAG: hypothetical protein IJJ26_11305 [Victivallales bacterium]|nr:hypothetical protein [Victivallales bacterium]
MNIAKLLLFPISLFPLCAVALTQPLPEGAHCDWELKNAWRRQSATEAEYCINGLWEFRNAPELKPSDNKRLVFQYDVETYDKKMWSFSNEQGIQFKVSIDKKEHSTGKASLRIDLEAPPKTHLKHGFLQLTDIPRCVPCFLSFDIKTDLQGFSCKTEVQDIRGFQYFTMPSADFPMKSDWMTVTVPFNVSGTCPAIRALTPRGPQGNVKGTIWVDNIRVYEQTVAGAVKASVPKDANWGYSLVPGGWLSNSTAFRHPKDKGANDTCSFGWYRRTVDIPAEWKGKRLSVRFDRIATSATLYCDGKMAGSVPFNGGEVDISRYATPGQKLELAVLVEARLPQEASLSYMGPNKTKITNAGIYGDVFLRVRNKIPCEVSRLCITTTTADRTLAVHAPLSAPVPDNATWRMDITRGGKPAASFQGTIPAGAKAIDAKAVWQDVQLWDVDSPVLYELRLSLLQDNKLLSQTLPERFGFRDFVIKGRHFYLNGVKIHLNPCSYWAPAGNWDAPVAMRHWMAKAQDTGYNFVYMEDNEMPDKYMATRQFLEICDEMGMLAAIAVPKVPRLSPGDLEGRGTEDWREVVKHQIENHINSPSLVLWRMNMNENGYAQDQNPLFLNGKRGFEADSPKQLVRERLEWSNRFVRSIDPSRHTYNHACGISGEIYTLNNYLGWPEQQDLREWLRVWAQEGEKPLMMVENGTPYPGDLQMRDPTSWWCNEPLQSEYAAILLGERSYQLEEPHYVDYIQSVWNAQRKLWDSSYGYFCAGYPRVLDECVILTYRTQYQYWRTCGIPGGINVWENNTHRRKSFLQGDFSFPTPPRFQCTIDWNRLQRPGRVVTEYARSNGSDGQIRSFFDQDTALDRELFEPTKHYAAFRRYMSRAYAYFGGPEARWYTVEHAYRAGETVEKTLVLLNDHRKPVTYEAVITLVTKAGTTPLATQSVTVPPAEVHFLPFQFKVPAVEAETNASLQATVHFGQQEVPVEPFAMQFHPATKVVAQRSGWVLLDPVGKTRDAFARLSWSLPEVSPDATLPLNCHVLVIGANALDTATGCTALKDAARRVPMGLRVLVCEHSEQTLERVFGLRAFTPGARQAWLRDSRHPVLTGMQDLDFTDWRGATTFGPLAGEPSSLVVSQRQTQKHVWRCSQEGVVASTIIEKPHVNVVHPLLDTGFALRYTPLWEVPCGQGSLLFCNLDITDRLARDPVADKLFANLTKYLQKNLPAQSVKVAYLGAPMTTPDMSVYPQKLLEQNGVQILGRGCRDWLGSNGAKLAQFAKAGGTVVALGLTEAEAKLLQKALGEFQVATAVNWLNPLEGTLPSAFRGLSIADLRWRKKLNTPVVADIPRGNGWHAPTGVLAELPVGKGRLVWVSAIPEDFPLKERQDMVFTNVQTARLINVVLQNLGVYHSSQNNYWAQRLASNVTANPNDLYLDKRTGHDDPYANMRW